MEYYRVSRESLHDSSDKKIGASVSLVSWEKGSYYDNHIDDTSIFYDKNEETSYNTLEWEAVFKNRDFAEISFMDESQLIKNVLSIDDTLTVDQCIDVLDLARHNHDANYGITWDTLSSYIDDVKEDSKPIIAGVDFTESLNLLNNLNENNYGF